MNPMKRERAPLKRYIARRRVTGAMKVFLRCIRQLSVTAIITAITRARARARTNERGPRLSRAVNAEIREQNMRV